MPTLLEKPPGNPPSSPPPPAVLHANHRWLHWRGTLLAGIIGLAVTLVALRLLPGHWRTPAHLAEVWAAGLLLTALAAAVAWRLSPASLLSTARKLDERYAAKNRLEAVALLETSTSPLARAQREETARHLNREPHTPAVRAWPWLVGLLLTLAVAHLIALLLWLVSLAHAVTPPGAPPPPPQDKPKAAIDWVSPTPETKANPVEEVPTVAVAKSSTGLRGLTLEVSVNGTAKKSTALPAEPYDKPGEHPIKVSVYLDEVDAQPYDIVSYYLRGQRIAKEKLPDTASPIQFIQVRPFRDDVYQGAGRSSKGYALLVRLKLAQLQAIKENFILVHSDLPPNHPVMLKENERVGKNQVALGQKTDEIVQAFTEEGVLTKIIDLLVQATPLMNEAGKKILATQNADALLPQQKALDLIVEIEKFFIKAMGPIKGPSSPNPDDPFKDKQKHEMTERLNAPSGQLELLAKNQTKLSQDLSHPKGQAPAKEADADEPTLPTNKFQPPPDPQAVDPFSPDAGKGTFVERQTRVLQGISVLQNGNKVFPETVNGALSSAQRDAGESQRQLNVGQEPSAREPATAAARDLQQAVDAMNASGEAETKEALSEARQKLGDLAARLRELAGSHAPDAAQKLEELAQQANAVRETLENAADHQQEAGSARGADQLNRLAEKIREQRFATRLAEMSKAGLDVGKATALANQLEDAAQVSAHALSPTAPTGQDYAAMVNSLERSRANLARLAAIASGNLKPDGAKPGAQPTANGQSPESGKAAEADKGSGKNAGQQPGQGQGQKPGEKQGQGQGQGPGQKPGDQQGQGQGQGQSPKPGDQQGQSQGEGQKPGDNQGQGQGQGNPNSPQARQPSPSDQKASGSGPGSGQSTGGDSSSSDSSQPLTGPTLQAYREALENLKNQTQETSDRIRTIHASDVQSSIKRHDLDTSYRPITPTDVVRFYADLEKPLNQLILELQSLQAHAQRSEIVQTPSLDDTPAAYRPAVSDYFEAVSRDYHPPAEPPPPPTPPADSKP